MTKAYFNPIMGRLRTDSISAAMGLSEILDMKTPTEEEKTLAMAYARSKYNI